MKDLKFDMPKDQSSIIKVIGVGGGGSNAVNYMYNQGIRGVDFIVCNTDKQALDISPIPTKIQLGSSLTEGRGAGSIPEIGKNAAVENIDEINDFLSKDTKMVFVTAGMGGGTGTGAAPVIANAARELGILTVGIVTMPFTFEGRKRKQQAESGLEAMRESVDTLLIINNDRLREMHGNLTLRTAFSHADDVLTTAAKGIAEVISLTGAINVDFNDVNTVMKDSGVAIMGQASAEGDNRAIKAAEQALASPLLNDNDISGATYVLLNIMYGEQEVLMDEISDITDYVQDEAGSTADVIWGHGYDPELGDKLSITIIATGFDKKTHTGVVEEPQKRVHKLEPEETKEIRKPLVSPVSSTSTEEPKEESEEPFLKSTKEAEVPAEEDKTQRTFEFEVKSPFSSEEKKETATNSTERKEASETQEQKEGEVRRYQLDEEEEHSTPEAKDEATDSLSKEEQEKLNRERFDRIRDLSTRLKTPTGLADLENEPAYKRRNVSLSDIPHSSDSNVSRFTLGEEENEDGDKKGGLRSNNSFLHDNVD